MMEVRKVNKNDIAIINNILDHHIDKSDKREDYPPLSHIEKLLDDDRCYLLTALINDKVIGYVLAYRFPSLYAEENLAYLYDIEVCREHRRKGAARLLIAALIGYLKNDAVKELWLGTGIDNSEGQALFSATGAVKTGETFNDYTYYLG